MANVYNFTVNNKMLVDAWDENITVLTGESASVAAGKKYYDVFPPLIFRDKDAVAFSIEKQRKLALKGYIFNCFFSRATADITIKPVLTVKGIEGAAIQVSNVSVCGGRTPEDIQRLIALGKIATSLAHGIRNPLNALKGAVEFVSQKYAEEKIIAEFAQIMREEISRLDGFISEFLATSLTEKTSSMVDINAVLRKIEKLIFFQALTQNISFDFRYGQIPLASINSYQFEQAVFNIINNAMEAIGSDGGLTVKTVLERSPERDYIVIEVSDDGPGMMTNKTSEKVTSGKSGKGFGLVITEEIMNNYGGRMDIKSMKDRGTTVRLYIPTNSTGGTNEKEL
jgi:two-component system nitrogen regulation sensor histidine kinase GlnL